MWIELPITWLIIVNILAWFFFHMSISYLMLQVPDRWFDKQKKYFLPRRWESQGNIWRKIFRVHQWKKNLPDGSILIKNSYDQTNLQGTEAMHFKKFIIETKRAELTHWLMILPAFLFFIWNPPWAGILIVIYALVFNLPLIIAQRYNRPRLQKVYNRMNKKSEKI